MFNKLRRLTARLCNSSRHRLATFLFVFLVSFSVYFTTPQLHRDVLVYRVGGSLRPSTKDFWEKFRRAPRVFQCAYASCPLKPAPPHRNSFHPLESNSSGACPSFFQWIQEDLAPWKTRGISKKLIQRAKEYASFRVLIVNGRLFLETYHPSFQSRALFTVWGLLQLLEFYPNLVPDVDLMFSCGDSPSIFRKAFRKKLPPPVFGYCSSVEFFDIAFPDWSYWGWPEINIGYWKEELSSILDASNHTPWKDRRSVAQWKGNPYVANVRMELLKCNSSRWSTEVFAQDWIAEGASGFSNSKRSNQCKFRYKIYVEGNTWSVSLKYLLACGSPVLLISPQFHDFFARGLEPLVSYWPVRSIDKMCESIKFAVDWGDSHPEEVEAIGRAGQQYISTEVSMIHVYDYMLHMLKQYAKLQKFKPVRPEKGAEVCKGLLKCLAEKQESLAMEESEVKEASKVSPCWLSDLDSSFKHNASERKASGLSLVRGWEEQSWIQ